ncbi:MAG: hypothetical protein AAB482_04225 [Patescibacteria group bacterium]
MSQNQIQKNTLGDIFFSTRISIPFGKIARTIVFFATPFIFIYYSAIDPSFKNIYAGLIISGPLGAIIAYLLWWRYREGNERIYQRWGEISIFILGATLMALL